jgi:hypothetical protein
MVSPNSDGSHLAFFVNKQPVADIIDTSYSDGQICFAVDEDNNTTEVVYNNVPVWLI